MIKGPNWTERDARRVVAAWRKSGVSIKAFAEREGIHRQRLFYWKRRLEKAAAEPRFVPAVVSEPASSAVAIHVGATTIEIATPALVPSEWLSDLVSTLAERACS